MTKRKEKKAKCELHNRAKVGEVLTFRETMKMSTCTQPSAIICPDTSCGYHIDYGASK